MTKQEKEYLLKRTQIIGVGAIVHNKGNNSAVITIIAQSRFTKLWTLTLMSIPYDGTYSLQNFERRFVPNGTCVTIFKDIMTGSYLVICGDYLTGTITSDITLKLYNTIIDEVMKNSSEGRALEQFIENPIFLGAQDTIKRAALNEAFYWSRDND